MVTHTGDREILVISGRVNGIYVNKLLYLIELNSFEVLTKANCSHVTVTLRPSACRTDAIFCVLA